MASRLPENGLQASERLRGGEQLLQVEYAQEAGPAERRIVDGVCSGKRPGVRLRGHGALNDRAGCAIEGKEVQKIADIHIDNVAERRDRSRLAQADAAAVSSPA
jgi:hypothetical protein